MEQLFTSEAISNYVVFALGILVGIIGWAVSRYLNRKRPREIRLLRVEEKSLLEIPQELQKKVIVKYGDRQTSSIYTTKFEIYNASENMIENIDFIVNFNEAKILDSVINDTIKNRTKDTPGSTHRIYFETNGNLRVELPYMNSKRLYDDIVTVEILTEEKLAVTDFQGGGRDWRGTYVDLVGLENKLETELKSISLRGGWLGLIEGVSDYLVRILPLFVRIRRSQR